MGRERRTAGTGRRARWAPVILRDAPTDCKRLFFLCHGAAVPAARPPAQEAARIRPPGWLPTTVSAVMHAVAVAATLCRATPGGKLDAQSAAALEGALPQSLEPGRQHWSQARKGTSRVAVAIRINPIGTRTYASKQVAT